MLKENPTLKDEVTGFTSPILLIDRSVAEYKYITIYGENWYGSASTSVDVLVSVCGDEQVSVAN